MRDREGIRLVGIFHIWCYGPDGQLKWEDEGRNLVVNVGLQHLLDVTFTGAAQVDPWYIGLVNGPGSGTTYDPGDTLSSHAGWTENSAYSGSRKEYDETRSSQTMSNSSSKAQFSITSDSQTLAGAFLCSVSSGTAGTLFSAADFTGGDKAANNGDTLEVTYEITATSS
jgi:hypothetical protein